MTKELTKEEQKAVLIAISLISNNYQEYTCVALEKAQGRSQFDHNRSLEHNYSDLTNKYRRFFNTSRCYFWEFTRNPDNYLNESDESKSVRRDERLTCLILFLYANS